MIKSPPLIYISVESVGLSTRSIWSYGTINLRNRYIKRVGKKVQGLEPTVIERKASLSQGASSYPFTAKDKHYIVLPTISDDGNKISQAAATKIYNSNGNHLGIFKDVKSAFKYANALDKRYKAWALNQTKFNEGLDRAIAESTFQYQSDDALAWYEGNIDLFNRPVYINPDKTISTVLSVINEFEIDPENDISEYVILPSIIMRNGVAAKLETNGEIIAEYIKTGQHLGKYQFLNTNKVSRKLALKAAKTVSGYISKQQSTYYGKFYSGADAAALSLPKVWQPVQQLIESGRGAPPFAGIVRLADISETQAQTTFQQSITRVSVDYSMDLTSQVVITVVDTDYRMMNSNYFVPRRIVEYRDRQYEIADVTCRAGQGGSPEVTITICPRAIQQMKRDKKRGSIKGNSGYEYARNVAIKYNLSFVGQKTAKTKSQFNARSGEQEESVWDVLTRTAGNNQFVCFMVDEILVYAQHEYLMWKFGLVEALAKTPQGRAIRKYTPLLYIPGNDGAISRAELDAAGLSESSELRYAPHSINRLGFRLENFPEFEASDNDPLAAQGSCRVLMPNGGQLRPGHTVLVGPQPDYFFGGYLVTSVAFDEGSPESATVSFRTPEEPRKQNGKPLVNKVGTSPARLVNRIQ